MWQLNPLVRVCIVFILGIIVGYYTMNWIGERIWLAAIVLSIVIYFLWRRIIVQSITLLIGIFCLGGWLTQRELIRLQPNFPSDDIVYEGVLLSQPTERGRVVHFNLLITSQNTPITVRATLLRDTITCRYQRLSVGDGIIVSSTLEKPLNVQSNSNFNYSLWLLTQGTSGQTFIHDTAWKKARVDYSHLSKWTKLKIELLKRRQRIVHNMHLLLDEQIVPLVAAISLGERSALSKEIREEFSIAGASHILALSGLHLGILYFFLVLILPQRRLRMVSAAIIIASLWAFAFLVGLPVSIIRATLMITVAEIARVIQRKSLSYNTLSFCAIVILVANPLALWDIGFQLSFLAVLSIFIYQPFFYNLLPKTVKKIKIIDWTYGMISVSLAAQILTAPLVMFYFERFSVYFLLTNIIIIPLSYFLLLSCCCWIVTDARFFTTLLVNKFAATMLFCVQKISNLPCASIESIQLNLIECVACYIIISSITFIFYRYRQQTQI